MKQGIVSEARIKKIVREIVAACKPYRVILFGSYARGNPREDSDLDVFVVANIPGRDSDKIRFVNHAISASGFAIDVVVRSPEELELAMNGRDWFIQEIVREGKVLYDRERRRVA